MISREDIEGLAKLARLQLTDVEVENLQKDFSSILEYVGQVNAVQTEGAGGAPALPLHHNIMRDDTPRAKGDQLSGKEDAIRAAFPTRKGDYNVVRKIIQKDA